MLFLGLGFSIDTHPPWKFFCRRPFFLVVLSKVCQFSQHWRNEHEIDWVKVILLHQNLPELIILFYTKNIIITIKSILFYCIALYYKIYFSTAWPRELKRRFYGDRDHGRVILVQLPLSSHTLLRPWIRRFTTLCLDAVN